MNEAQIQVELTFKGESQAEAQELLAEAGASEVDSRGGRGFTGIETVLIGMLLADGITRLVSRLARSWRCGVVVVVAIDGKKVSTEKNCDLPRGTVLMVHPDGTQVSMQEPTEAQVSSWFKDAFKAVSGGG